MADAVRIVGLAELERAFARADRAVRDDMRDALAEAAAPVRSDAQSLAASEIRNLQPGDPWAGMRIGVSRTVAYVASTERGVNSRGGQPRRRPRFADLLMGRAMQPALVRNRERVTQRVQRLVDEVADVWERS